jgi:two-component system, NtrC family, sensor kinase
MPFSPSASPVATEHVLQPTRPGSAFRMLVVDDNPAIHDDVRKVLVDPSRLTADVDSVEEKLFGSRRSRARRLSFEIDSAYQGDDALDMVRQAVQAGAPYAIAFVDMRMPPGSDGLKTIVALWKIDPLVQIVICSAYSDYSWEEIAESAGETDQLVILRKPFEPIEVLQLAHALTKKWELQRVVRRQMQGLEAQVLERTLELREKQAIFELILENATDLIAVVDAAGRRVYNSPSYRTVLGLDPEAMRNTPSLGEIHPDDRPAVEQAIETARATGRGALAVYRMRHQDGSWRTLESCAGVVREPDGRLACFVIVARDVTQRREFELKLQLGQKLESIGRLAAGIAHEINTPTQYIADNTRFLVEGFQQFALVLEKYRGWRERLAADPDHATAAGELEQAETAADLGYLATEIPRALQQNLEGLGRVSRIVLSLKEFSHPNSPDKAPADLNRAIETAVAVCRHEWKYVADVATEFDPELPPVPCILDEFNQVMLNLLVNAAHTIGDALKKRGEKRGTITVRTRHQEQHVVVEVSDTGMGIPPELHGRMFEPFFTTKEVGKGTGQGLAIVHAVVVKHHGGTVDFATEPGKGTTFRLRLPVAGAPAAP